MGGDDNAETVTAMDLGGEVLWTSDSSYATANDDRLLLSVGDKDTSSSRVFEVNHLTGSPVNKDAYEGEWFYVQQTQGGSFAAIGRTAVTFLDERLQSRATIDTVELGLVYEGTHQLFLTVDPVPSDMTDRRSLVAISKDDFSVQRKLKLEENQFVQQAGQHLVVNDHGTNTIHGLWSSTN